MGARAGGGKPMGARGVVRPVSQGSTQARLPLSRARTAPRWLCLHAVCRSGATFDGIAKRLARDVSLRTRELAGADANPLEHDVAATLQSLAREPAPVVLVGHAYGGVVALEVARREPARVRHLVL